MLLSLVASFLVSSELWTLYHDFCFVLNTSFGGSMLSFMVARRPPNPDRVVVFGPLRSSWRPPSCDSEVSSSSRWPYLWEIVIGSSVYDWFSFKYTVPRRKPHFRRTLSLSQWKHAYVSPTSRAIHLFFFLKHTKVKTLVHETRRQPSLGRDIEQLESFHTVMLSFMVVFTRKTRTLFSVSTTFGGSGRQYLLENPRA